MKRRTRKEAEQIAAKVNLKGLSKFGYTLLVNAYINYEEQFCNNCYKTGRIYRVRKGEPTSILCMCMRINHQKKMYANRLAASGIPEKYTEASIEGWINPGRDDTEKGINQECLNYISSFLLTRFKEHGLFLCGSHGVGKTYLACAIANKLMSMEQNVKYYTMADLIRLSTSWKDDDDIRDFENAHLTKWLVIDDIDKFRRTQAGSEISVLDNLLRRRLQNGSHCIITSDRVMADAVNDYGSSIHEMLQEACVELVFVGASKRKLAKKSSKILPSD